MAHQKSTMVLYRSRRAFSVLKKGIDVISLTFFLASPMRNTTSYVEIYKETALFFGFYSGFTRGEYHIVCVDFIFSSRGRLERDRGFANPLSLSNTSPDPFGGSAAAGHICCRGGQGYRIPVSGADRSSPLRRIDWVLGVRAWTVRVSIGLVGLRSFVFHYWGKKDAVCLALTHVF